MGIKMEESLSQADLAFLADRCAEEVKLQRRKQVFDERYCLEIFHRAIVQRVDQAWTILQQRFGETVRIWIRRHPSNDLALQRDSEENYVAQTFTRFWHAVRHQRVEFTSMNAALSYLHATLNGVIMDTVRASLRAKEVALPPADSPEEPSAYESDESYATWQSIESLLPNTHERRLAYLLYFCGLKPREIVARCPEEFADIKEVYRLSHNILERLRRNRERLRWLLGDE